VSEPANAFDDLPPLSVVSASAPAQGANPFDDITPPVKSETKTESPSIASQLERGAGLTGRALIQGMVGLPGQMLDAGHSLYDLATNPQARSATWEQLQHPSQWLTPPKDAPTQEFDRALDPYLPTPQTTGEKLASIPLSIAGGAMTPQIPTGVTQAPANFMPPAQQKAQLLAAGLKNAQDAGYVVPPSTTNPTRFNRVLESVAGKENTQNEARAINQEARNAGAAQDLGLKPEVFTPGAVAAVKSEAGQAIEAAKSIPRFQTSPQFGTDLDKILEQTRGANKDFPGASNPDVENLVNTYRVPSFTGDSGVSAIKLLRGKANDAYAQGNSEMGIAYKGISRALEEEMERGAQQAGGPYADLVNGLRQARKTYAQASTIEDASDAAGNVSGTKLAAAWNRNEPLSGNLLTAAEHAANYPKANLPANSSNVRKWSFGASAVGAAEGYHVGGVKGAAIGGALPLTSEGARAYLLSGRGQTGALPAAARSPSALSQALKARAVGSAAGVANAP
jgi:hypothetical protein